MVIDSSAIIAILLKEPDARWVETTILKQPLRYMSAVSIVECSIVLDSRHGNKASGELDDLITRMEIEVVPVSVEQAEAARHAFRDYGRGRHKAGLNFGDCFSYALSKVSGEALLYKGNDFALTDLATTSPPPSPQNK
jgi:ribonuclease VapC